MPDLNTYLFFNGTCADAMRFYERILGGKLETLLTHAEALPPDQIPPGSADRIMHARLVLPGGAVLMASDTRAEDPDTGFHGYSLSLVYPDAAEGRRIFDALAEGGKVTMPYDKTFWSEGFGMLNDRFGVPWMVNGGMNQT
jgi:PhnB protein